MKSLVFAAAAAVALAALTACNHATVDAKGNDPAPPVVEEARDLNVATVEDPGRFKLATVELRKEANELSANGIVSPDVSRSIPVNALVGGRVLDVRVKLGDEVRKGQPLLTMTSPDMSAAISDFEKFRADQALAKSQFERAQILYQHGALAQKDLQVSEDTYTKAKVDTQTSEDRIRILGGDPDHPSGVIEVRAPVSGTITEQNVTNSAGVKSPDNSPNLFTISDLSRVWIICDVYENNLAQVHVGDRADVQLNAYPDRHIQGRISNIGTLLDPTTRTAKVRIDLANPNGTLRPNMFANVRFTSQGTQSRMFVPLGAVLRLQDRDWIYRKLNEKQFRRTEVQAGPATADGRQVILSGVKPGDQVATNALEISRAIENQQEQAQK